MARESKIALGMAVLYFLVAVPLIDGVCTGAILAGPNRIADTQANNRGTSFSLSPFITSAYRNPQRNFDVKSTVINSKHVEGRALDIDPDIFPVVPGKTTTQLFCYLERAGELVEGVVSSVTEARTLTGELQFIPCTTNNPPALRRTIVHIEN